MKALLPLVLGLVLLTGCSTLKSWFTPEGRHLAAARALAQAGHPLGASAEALAAYDLDPEYTEALRAFRGWFAPGQDELASAVPRWKASSDPQRWERLFELYTWQATLARLLPGHPDLAVTAPFDPEDLAAAARQAALGRFAKARDLLPPGAGPRTARLALAEGRQAEAFDPQTPGLAEWLAEASEAAAQKLMVIPFFQTDGWSLGTVSASFGSVLSRTLAQADDLPDLTTVFSSDRLVSLPGGGLARAGLVSQPDALVLARSAGQNLVLLGQITRAAYRAPQKTVTVTPRTVSVTVVDPAHPQGQVVVYRAVVTRTLWVEDAALTASWALVDVASGADLATGTAAGSSQDQLLTASFTGDSQALTDEDRRDLAFHGVLASPSDLSDAAQASLAHSVAEGVLRALQ